MMGWTRLLRSGKLDEESATRALDTIERNVKSQAQLIEDLLDISRITTGKLRLNAQPVDLESVIKAATDALMYSYWQPSTHTTTTGCSRRL